MQFNRNANRDDRRRRVLSDDTAAHRRLEATAGAKKAGSTGGEETDNGTSNLYSNAALPERQPRVTDLVPRRPWVIALLLILGLATVAGLESLYAWMPALSQNTTDGRIAALDLDGEGSLAAWFSSAVLAVSAAMALLVYSVRRHRLDDYHGRYRIWLWAATCWTVMSIDEGGSLHEGFKEMMVQLTGSRVMGDGSVWWAAPYCLALGYVGIRLLLDMRACRGSTIALLGTAACYAVGVVIQLGLLLPDAGARAVMFEEGAEMVGNVLLALSMSLHARFVIREAGGRLPARESEKKSAAAAKGLETPELSATATAETSAAGHQRRSDLQPAESQAKAAARKAEEEFENQFDDEPLRRNSRKNRRIDRSESEEPSQKLSKAQRKALRRQKERERQEGLR